MRQTIRIKRLGVPMGRIRKKEYFGDELTHSEARVMAGIIRGDSNQLIADNLFITLGGVKYHITNMNKKLGIKAGRSRAIICRRWYVTKDFDQNVVYLVQQFVERGYHDGPQESPQTSQ